jgi:hypothetical protein
MSVGYLDQAFPAHRRGKNRARQLNAPEQNLYLWILQQFAGGEPPSAADTKERATQNGLDFSAAAASLARDDLVHLGRDGRPLIAYPFSAISRGHSVTISRGRRVEAMCALDALGIATMLAEHIQIDSHDPNTRTPVHVEVGPDGQAEVAPATAVVLVGSSCQAGPSYLTCCDTLNFFESSQSAERYLDAHPELTAICLKVPEATKLANAIFADVLADN